MLNRRWLWGVPVGALLIFSLAQAQDAQQGQGQGRGRGRGNFDPAQMREQRMNDMKERLGATDDEWKVLQPKLTKVMDAQRESFGGMFGGRGGRGGRGGDRGGDQAQNNRPNNTPETKLMKAQSELRTTLENKTAPNGDVQAKLKAYREARDKARTDLQAAQKDLKEVCSVRQEAALVMAGMLE